jgi:hypothetical protein
MIERIVPKAKMTALVEPLKERLSQLETRATEARKALQEIDGEKQLVTKLLEIELRRVGAVTKRRRRQIPEIVDGTLLEGPTNKETLNRIAVDDGHEAPARSINAVLIGYVKNGIADKSDDGTYTLTEKGYGALSRKADSALPGLEALRGADYG